MRAHNTFVPGNWSNASVISLHPSGKLYLSFHLFVKGAPSVHETISEE